MRTFRLVFYTFSFNFERQAGKLRYQLLNVLVWFDKEMEPWSIDYEADVLTTIDYASIT